MTKQEFDNCIWTGNIQVKISGKYYPLLTIDIETGMLGVIASNELVKIHYTFCEVERK